ncbi:MAG TPA: hypothetical protein VK667_05380, partial [Ktedonobacteraceae bacterium]|nr:hypothetical protein [Ktedonobacteraceae bacterium]
ESLRAAGEQLERPDPLALVGQHQRAYSSSSSHHLGGEKVFYTAVSFIVLEWIFQVASTGVCFFSQTKVCRPWGKNKGHQFGGPCLLV